jgi:transcription termination factor NusB
MYQNDQWNITDELGMDSAGDGLAKIALDVTAPFTIAVTGKWGSGKTSVMRRAFATLGGHPINQAMPLQETGKSEVEETAWYKVSILPHRNVEKALNSKAERDARRALLIQRKWSEDLFAIAENSLCIWFSPWQHQNADNPLIPLLLEIQAQFLLHYKLSKSRKDFARRSALAAMTLLERVGDLALSLNGKNTALAGTTEAVQKSWQNSADNLTQLSDGQRFHLLFEDAIETALKGLSANGEIQARDRMVIFIDDLDRCEGETVVMLLEAIKLYLGTQRCVFVLGLDNTAILSALDHYWENRSEDHNREYLEKLFQATVRVPAPNAAKAQDLLAAQLTQHHVPEAQRWAKEMVNLLEPNPRKLKNFTNSFCVIWTMHSIPAEETQILRLILFLYLSLYHPAVWRILERQPWSLCILTQVLNDTTNEYVDLPKHIDKENQRMMASFFSQAFNHVLKHDHADNSQLDDKHRGVDLDKAVDLFLERIDRKGSDEYFVYLSSLAFVDTYQVDEHFLCLGSEI